MHFPWPNKWYIDSGCYHHMDGDKSKMELIMKNHYGNGMLGTYVSAKVLWPGTVRRDSGGRLKCEISLFHFPYMDLMKTSHVYTWVLSYTVTYTLVLWSNIGRLTKRVWYGSINDQLSFPFWWLIIVCWCYLEVVLALISCWCLHVYLVDDDSLMILTNICNGQIW